MPMIFSWFGRRIIHMGYENHPTLWQQWRILGNVRKYDLSTWREWRRL